MELLNILGNYEYLNKKYIVANLEQHMKILNYQIEMINNNQGNGLLFIEKKQFNADIQLQYDTKKNSTLEDYIKNKSVKSKDLALILKNIIGIIKLVSKYLLDENSLIINSKYIFIDEIRGMVELIYLPVNIKIDAEFEFRNMLKEIVLKYINEDEQDKKEFSERILSIVNSDNYSIDVVSKELENIIGKSVEIINAELSKVDIGQRNEEKIEKKEKKGFLSKLFKTTENNKEQNNVNTEEFMKGVNLSRREILTRPMYETDMINDTYNHLIFNKNGSIDKVNINKEEFLIGRLKGEVDYILDNPAVGKIHAKIVKSKGDYYLVDLKAKNYTFINGEKLKPSKMYQLHNGDEITFANVKAEYRKV